MYEGRFTGFRPPDVPVEELGLLMAGSGGDAAPAEPAQRPPETGAKPETGGAPEAEAK
jgi:hypothetical protein